jgi:SAM-dependent methyltransferase
LTRTCSSCGGALTLALASVADSQTRDRFDILRCVECGLGHTDPVYHDFSRYYGAAYYGERHGPTNRLCTWRRVRMLRRIAGAADSRRLLDVGCGDGSFLLAAQRAGWRVVGVEKHAAPARAAGIDTRESLEAAAADAPYDCVTMWHTLEHFPDPRGTLSAIVALLAPQGRLIVAVPDAGGWQARVFGRHWIHLDVPRHLHHFDVGSLTRVVEHAGARVERWWHQELEYDLIGLAQSASNVAFREPNIFLKWVTGRPTGAGRAVSAIAVASAAALSAAMLPLVPLASSLGRGGTLVLAARRT